MFFICVLNSRGVHLGFTVVFLLSSIYAINCNLSVYARCQATTSNDTDCGCHDPVHGGGLDGGRASTTDHIALLFCMLADLPPPSSGIRWTSDDVVPFQFQSNAGARTGIQW